MARSGSITIRPTFSHPRECEFWLTFEWEITAQSIANNTSVIAWRLKLKGDEDARVALNRESITDYDRAYITVNGTYTPFTKIFIHLSNEPDDDGNYTNLVASGVETIAHEADGSKTFNYSFELRLADGLYANKIHGFHGYGSGSGVLDNTYILSTLSVEAGALGTEHVLTINRDSDNYHHRVTFNCGDVAGYILGADGESSNATSVKWTPQQSLAWQVTDSTMVPIVLTLWTYTKWGTYCGSTTLTIECKIPDDIRPIVTTTVTDLTGFDAVYGNPVQGLSQAHVVVTGRTAYGSPLMRYTIISSGIEYVTDETDLPVYSRPGDYIVAGRIKDARGRIGLHEVTVNVLPYSAPAVPKLSVRRCDEDGTEHAQGEFVEVTFSAKVSDIAGKNTAQYVLRYKPTGSPDSEYTTVNFPELNNVLLVQDKTHIFPADLSRSYDVIVIVSDNHGSATRSTVASTGFSFMDWHTSGTGLSFGKVAEKPNTMEIALTTEFIGPQTQLGNHRVAYIPEENENADSTGYDLMARISVTNTYANSPMTFVFTRRNELLPMTVHVTLANSNTLDPIIGFMGYEGANYGAYLVHTETSIWDLYVARGSAFDFITLQSWHMAQYMESRVRVTFPGTFSSILPDGAIQVPATGGPNLVDVLFPVGSIVLRYDLVNPGTLYPGTNWTQITARILRAVAAGGTIGGEGTVSSESGRTYIDIAVWRRIS